jgi:hypothetical protein
MPSSQYPTVPHFTGIPTFNVLNPNPQSSMSTPSSAQMSAQIQHFQLRQEYLMASAQRRMQQDLEMARKRGRGPEALPTPVSAVSQFPEFYSHRASLPANFESSLHHDPIIRGPEQHLASYNQLRPSDPSMYSYVHELQTIPYAASLSSTLFRHPAIVEVQPRRQSPPPSASELEEKVSDAANNPDPTSSADSSILSNNSSQTSLPLHATNTEDSVADIAPTRLSDEYSKQDPTTVVDDIGSGKEVVQLGEDSLPDSFPVLERMFDSWDAADTEWLYSLQTECAKPGAVCECGDSCCCPGCFTHTNNPGDRGVYQAMLSKLGTMLETEEEENESSRVGKPCLSTTSKPEGHIEPST